MAGYYDFVLGLIPLALGGIAAVLTGVGFELTTAVQLGSVAAVALIGHALFVNAPVDSLSGSGGPVSEPEGSDSFQLAD